PRDPEAGEDLSALGEVPVAEARRDDPSARGPRAAAQDPVVGAEEDLRVLLVGMRGEARIAVERAGGPLPHVADHAQAAMWRRALGVGMNGGGAALQLVDVRVGGGVDGLLTPGERAGGLAVLV